MTDSNTTANDYVDRLHLNDTNEQKIPIDEDVALKQLLKHCDIIHDSSVIDIIPSTNTTIMDDITASIKIDVNNKAHHLSNKSSNKVLLGKVSRPLSKNVESLDDEILYVPNNPEEIVDSNDVAFSNNAMLQEDVMIKQKFKNEPCHPVAFVIGEYTAYPTSVIEVHDENDVQNEVNDEIFPEVSNPVCNNIHNKRDQKNLYNSNDPNHKIPGAIRVRGINPSICEHSSSQFIGVNDSSELHLDLEFSHDQDQSQSLYVTKGDLAPIELLERVEAVPWIDQPGTFVGKETDEKKQIPDMENERFIWSIKNEIMRRFIIVISILFVICFIVSASIFIPGRCKNNNNFVPNQDKTNQDNTSQANTNQDNTSNVNTSQYNTRKYKSFNTKIEIITALDALLSGQNTTPSLEETYGNITDWDVSIIEDFSHLFDAVTSNVITLRQMPKMLNSKFNLDISRWDVSSAINMSCMFYGADSFNGDLSKWNTSRVKDMSYFMANATIFDSNLSQWNTSQFVNTSHMFIGAWDFTGNGLESWDVSKIQDASYMFSSSSFNGNLSKWNVSQVHDASYMFAYADSFDGDLSRWDVSKVKSMVSMFQKARSFQGIGLDSWNPSQVTNFEYMFDSASLFDANLSQWNTSNSNNMQGMFYDASSFKGHGLEYWDTSSVKVMSSMFMCNGAVSNFEGIGLENWNTSQVINFDSMFDSALLFNANLSRWDTSNAQSMSAMFHDAPSFKGNGLEYWDTSSVKVMSSMFMCNAAVSNFEGIELENWNISQVVNFDWMFYNASLFNANLSRWDTSNAQSMSLMFYDASSFQGNGLESWNVSSATNMASMFGEASLFNANLADWDISKVEYADWMFANAIRFRGIGLEQWDTTSLMTIGGMFSGANSFNQNLSNWNVSKVYDMNSLFANAVIFQGIGLDQWNVSSVSNAGSMFDSAISFNANLSEWNYINIKNKDDMFRNATSFEGVFWMDE